MVNDEKIAVGFYLPQKIVQILDQKRGRTSRSAYVTILLERLLTKGARWKLPENASHIEGETILPKTSPLVNLRNLKQYAMAKLPSRSPLREVLLNESDEIDAMEYLAKLKTWLVLLRYSTGESKEWWNLRYLIVKHPPLALMLREWWTNWTPISSATQTALLNMLVELSI